MEILNSIKLIEYFGEYGLGVIIFLIIIILLFLIPRLKNIIKNMIEKIKKIWNKIKKWWRLFDGAHIDTMLGRISYLGAGLAGAIALLLLTNSVVDLLRFIHITDFIKGGDKVKEYIYIFYLSSPLIFILWMLRTHDSLNKVYEKPYFEGLGALAKEDKYSKKLAFKLLIPLMEKGAYVDEIKNVFMGMNLTGVDLSGMNLTGLNFDKTIFTDAILKNCNLSNLDFSKSTLLKTNFEDSNVKGVDFGDSPNRILTLKNTNLKDVKNIKLGVINFELIRGALLEGLNINHLVDRIWGIKIEEVDDVKKMFEGVYYNDDSNLFWEQEHFGGGQNYMEKVGEEIKKVMIKKK